MPTLLQRLAVPALCLAPWLTAAAVGDEAAAPAKTRPEMKRRIEALKERNSRLPLPALTEEQKAAGLRSVNNGRLRSLYLPESWQSPRTGVPAANGRGPAPALRLGDLAKAPDFAFKTRLFWIVSRTNDCQYCLGHQELKLRRAGMAEDQIAALDSRWNVFPDDEQVAMRVTRLMTLTPHRVTDQDLASLKEHFSDAQVLDIIQTVAGYNSTNRWTASTGIPQDRSFGEESADLDTPTSAEFASVETKVAPYDYQPRPAWESRATVEAAMQAAVDRQPLIVLPSATAASKLVAVDSPGTTPPVWFQAMSINPQTALRTWKQRQALVRDGKLDPLLRAQIAWVCAREDRAWYAAAHALARLQGLGVTPEAAWSTGEASSSATPVEEAVLSFARKLTSAPHTVTDDDIAGLRKLLSDHEVAEVIALICDANSFDRFTEMLRLPLEASLAG